MKISCPCCSNSRLFDSDKITKVAKLSNSNNEKADMVIKCSICKNEVAVKFTTKNKDKPPKGCYG